MSEKQTFAEVDARLQEIAREARKKDVSLASALDLFDEAIALGNAAVDLVDSSEFSESELDELSKLDEGSQEASNASDDAQ